ncbi:MAG: hypothetical protein HY343_04520 [Lentisphaerae bacterium]|nr:hypothetical protein [Lentisphaerota bacterium]
MRLWIAGQERSADLGPGIVREARALDAAHRSQVMPSFGPDYRAEYLKESRSESDYEKRLFTLIRNRYGIASVSFAIPRKPGFVWALMGVVRRFLWKLLRYQHDRMAFQQNLINLQTVNALRWALDAKTLDIQRLEERLAALERRNDIPAPALETPHAASH